MQDKITVCATDDSYKVTRERMSQVEKDILGRSAIEIKPGPPYQGKCVKVQKKAGQAPGPDGLSKHSPTYKRSCPAGSAGVTVHRPLRERLIHLLALKPYRKPDLLLWLERERASPREKAELTPLLEEVAKQNPRDQSFTLKDDIYPLVQRDWPGYQEEERRFVYKLLARKLQPAVSSSQSKSFQSNAPFPRSLGESPSHLSPVKSPAVKRPVPSNSLENQAHKKSRVLEQSFRLRHLSGDPQAAGGHRGPAHSSSPPPGQAEPRPESLGIEPGGHNPSGSSQQHKRRKSRKQKEKEREKEEWRKGGEEHKQHASVEDHESVNTPASPTATEELPDYLLKYHTITGLEQRQKYKDDFCAEYDEYRNLHSRIGSVIEMFVRLGSKIKTLSPGTQEYKVMEEQILEKYQKYRKVREQNSELHLLLDGCSDSVREPLWACGSAFERYLIPSQICWLSAPLCRNARGIGRRRNAVSICIRNWHTSKGSSWTTTEPRCLRSSGLPESLSDASKTCCETTALMTPPCGARTKHHCREAVSPSSSGDSIHT
uniref:Si:ch211-13k12.2 n=1 Tax=Paramormyrops kingsleyae TaxID=1676925 RepID=A0A3B3QBM9_9TELE